MYTAKYTTSQIIKCLQKILRYFCATAESSLVADILPQSGKKHKYSACNTISWTKMYISKRRVDAMWFMVHEYVFPYGAIFNLVNEFFWSTALSSSINV